MSKTIRVAVFIPGCAEPAFTEIENTLESWQGLCGGLVESRPLAYGLTATVNEEGKLLGLPAVRAIQEQSDWSNELWHDTFNGPFFAALEDGDDIASLRPEDEALLHMWKPGLVWDLTSGDFITPGSRR